MIDLVETLNKEFNGKYNYLKFLNVVFEKSISLCTVTFLYPYDIDKIENGDQKEIQDYIQKLFSLNASVKVKFRKSYLDEKLIKYEVVEFFKNHKKGLIPYISDENITSSHEDKQVLLKIKLNSDVLGLIDEIELKNQIKEYLERLFIAAVSVDICENEETLPDEVECDDIIPVGNKARRYKVTIEKKIIGKDIVPMPEYIIDNKRPKQSVILSGVLSNKNKKTFTIKKGKRAGEEKSLYTFTLKDAEGEIECIYFASKTHEKDLENLDELSMILCVGDINVGLSGKLTYYIRKIFLCSPFVDEKSEEKDEVILKGHKQVVFPDILPRSLQPNIFDVKPNYNDLISNNNIVVFDIETTGLDPETCEITEIGAVKIEKGEVTERFSSFARTKEPIPIEVQNLTHITNEMLVGAPKIEDVICDFYNWSKGCVISGYNIIGFDMKFIRKVAERIGLNFDNQIVDTIVVARQSKLRTTNYKLGTVVKALGLELVDAHRAFNDAYATAQVLLELSKI